jgi:hypothetical protein
MGPLTTFSLSLNMSNYVTYTFHTDVAAMAPDYFRPPNGLGPRLHWSSCRRFFRLGRF